MKKIIISILLLIVTVMLFVIFFNKKKENTSSLKTIKVAEVTHSIFYAPQYLAISKGYFSDEGIDVELILTPGVNMKNTSIKIDNIF